MKNPSYKVGMLVEHPARPQWGPGRVMAVAEGRVHVVFRDELESKAKAIITEIVPLNVAEAQTDAVLDLLPPATQEGGVWLLPKNYERFLNRPVAKTPKTPGSRRGARQG